MMNLEETEKDAQLSLIGETRTEIHQAHVILDLVAELRAARKVAEAARPLLRCLELLQQLDELPEKEWQKELALQQALKELDDKCVDILLENIQEDIQND